MAAPLKPSTKKIAFHLIEDVVEHIPSKSGGRTFRIRIWRRRGDKAVTLIQDVTGEPLSARWLGKAAGFVRAGMLHYADSYFFFADNGAFAIHNKGETLPLGVGQLALNVVHFNLIGNCPARAMFGQPIVQDYGWDSLANLLGREVEP